MDGLPRVPEATDCLVLEAPYVKDDMGQQQQTHPAFHGYVFPPAWETFRSSLRLNLAVS